MDLTTTSEMTLNDRFSIGDKIAVSFRIELLESLAETIVCGLDTCQPIDPLLVIAESTIESMSQGTPVSLIIYSIVPNKKSKMEKNIPSVVLSEFSHLWHKYSWKICLFGASDLYLGKIKLWLLKMYDTFTALLSYNDIDMQGKYHSYHECEIRKENFKYS